jgi:cytochrome c oxidase cbb3-type subunit III
MSHPHRSTYLLASMVCLALGCSRAPREAPAPAVPDATVEAPAARAEADAGPPPPSVAHGAALYGRMCAICHGAEGEGYKADQAPAIGRQDFLASVSDEFLRFAIEKGRQGTTMSAWAKDQGGPLDERDVSSVVQFLRSRQTQPKTELDESVVLGDARRGQAIFKRSCDGCHGQKAPNVRLLNRQWLHAATPGFMREAIAKGRLPTPMVPFQKSLGKQGIDDVVAFLKSLPSALAPGEMPGMPREVPIPLGPVVNAKGPAPKGFKAFPEMTSADVVGPELKRGARMMLLDARVPSDYLASHIAGAVSVPFYDPIPYVEQLPRDTWLVCYCGCPHAESGALARQLATLGFTKVTVLDEGLYYWQEHGYPMASGQEPSTPAATGKTKAP